MMAGEDGVDNEDAWLDDKINPDGDDDDEQEVNRTRPFQPGASSTPYHGGEEHVSDLQSPHYKN